MLDDEGQRAHAALHALQEIARTDEELRSILGDLAAPSGDAELALHRWLSQRPDRAQTHPDLANYVSGGYVDKIVTIARAETVNLIDRGRATSLYGLPRAIADLTGRGDEADDLVKLLQASSAQDGAVAISAIAGKPGVGKTALAIHVAHLLRDRYPDGQLYVNLRGAEPQPLDANDVLEGFLQDLGLTANAIPQNVDRRASVFRAQLSGRRVLVVLDNATDEAHIRPLLPGSSTCAVIVTSRPPMAGLEGANLRVLDVIDAKASVELLGKIAGPARVSAEPEAADRVVHLCGHLPLALRIAGGLLAQQPTATLPSLAHRLEDERRRLDELRLGDLEVRASLALSYDALDVEAAQLFRRLTVLPGPDFDAQVGAVLDRDDDPDITEEVIDERHEDAERVLRRLAHAQLLETPAEDRYRFHDLIAVFAGERARSEDSPETLKLAASRARAWYLTFAQVLDFTLSQRVANTADATPGVEAAAIRAKGFAALTRERANLLAAIEQAHAAGDWQTAEGLTASVTHFMNLRGQWDDWARARELTLDGARKSGDRDSEARALHDLGLLHSRKGQLDDAYTCYEQALVIVRELGDRHAEAQALCSSAYVQADMGRPQAAIESWAESLRIMRELGDLGGEASALTGLGGAYSAQLAFRHARECFERSLAITRELKEPHDEARVLNGLAGICAHQDQLDAAVGYCQQSIRLMRDLGDRYEEACILGNLASVYHKQRRYAEAVSTYELAVTIYRELGDKRGEENMLQELELALRATNAQSSAGQRSAVKDSARAHAAPSGRSGEVLTPGPDAHADPQRAADLNRRYIEDLAQWEALPWLRRRVVRRPQRPRGI